MKESIGFVKASMPDEKRIALFPEDILKVSKQNRSRLFFEKSYARHLGISDEEYLDVGAKIVSRDYAYNSEVLCIPKPWINDIDYFKNDQTLAGWLYLAEDSKIDLTNAVLENNMSAIAWEKMYGPEISGKKKFYPFEKNRWFAGYISTNQALPFASGDPNNLKIGVLGRGRVAQGAFQVLKEKGLSPDDYDVYGRDGFQEFLSKMSSYDIIINCWYYDPKEGDYLSFKDMQKMKAGALFIDVTAEGVQGSLPQPAYSPFYQPLRLKNILIYHNNHSPSFWPKESSEVISKGFYPFVDLILNGWKSNALGLNGDLNDYVLNNAQVVKNGTVLDQRINDILSENYKRPEVLKTY